MDYCESVKGAKGVSSPLSLATGAPGRCVFRGPAADRRPHEIKNRQGVLPRRFLWCPEPDRTSDTGIFSPLLYRLSYLGIVQPVLSDRLFGDAEGARTLDLQRDRLAF